MSGNVQRPARASIFERSNDAKSADALTSRKMGQNWFSALNSRTADEGQEERQRRSELRLRQVVGHVSFEQERAWGLDRLLSL